MPLIPFSSQPLQVDLEQLVRPFGTVLNSPTRGRPGENDTALDVTTTEPELAVLTWSARAGVETTDLPTLSVVLDDDEDDDDGINGEINRTFHTQRITQEGNADNWVDVEVPDDITFKNQAQQKRKYTFASS